jgi:hypothetical protein
MRLPLYQGAIAQEETALAPKSPWSGLNNDVCPAHLETAIKVVRAMHGFARVLSPPTRQYVAMAGTRTTKQVQLKGSPWNIWMQSGNLLLHNLQLCNLRLFKAHVTDTIAVIRERHYETQRSRATIQDPIRNHLYRLECEIKVARAMHGLCGRCLRLRAVTLAYSTLTVAVISKRQYEFPLSRDFN